MGYTGRVIEHATPDDVSGNEVIGALPLYLASEAESIMTIDMLHLRPEQRGADLTPEEMDSAGAHLVTYVVIRCNGFSPRDVHAALYHGL